ncbi:hypothetical protein VIGAN_09134100 [Vigna angularis var. angularis]|uniref:Uncharacterized protein n=1 Tax=Vigna angularis var. angularis TaxID=157739 RepID=A0A0S3SYI1_PHAAN|nr:hypothetical protein VIGAN_09134100 [Vigna angularis var. angularis]
MRPATDRRSPSTDRCTGATKPDRAPHQTRQSGHRCSYVRSVLRQQPQLRRRRSLHRHQRRMQSVDADLPSVRPDLPSVVAASRRRCVLGVASSLSPLRPSSSHIAHRGGRERGGEDAEKRQRRRRGELVKCCYGDRGNSRFILGVSKEVFGRESSFVKYSEEVFILREVFGGGVHLSLSIRRRCSSFVKTQRRCSFISFGIKRDGAQKGLEKNQKRGMLEA